MSETPPLLFEDSEELLQEVGAFTAAAPAMEQQSQVHYSPNTHTFVVKRANSQEIDEVVKSEDVSLSPKKPKFNDGHITQVGESQGRGSTPMDLGDVEIPQDIVEHQKQSKKLREVITELKLVDALLVESLNSVNRRFYP